MLGLTLLAKFRGVAACLHSSQVGLLSLLMRFPIALSCAFWKVRRLLVCCASSSVSFWMPLAGKFTGWCFLAGPCGCKPQHPAWQVLWFAPWLFPDEPAPGQCVASFAVLATTPSWLPGWLLPPFPIPISRNRRLTIWPVGTLLEVRWVELFFIV